MTAQTCHPFTNFDTKISVYSNSCGDLKCENADDDSCPGSNKAKVQWIAERDVIYYILVHGWVTNPVGDFAVWAQTREPPNDQCAWAQGPLAVGESVEGTSLYATLNFGGSGAAGSTCDGAYGNVEGVWYYTFGTGNTMTADTCDDRTGYDTKIHVFTGECEKEGDSEGLSCVRGNDNSSECGGFVATKSKVYWDSVLGEMYYIYVHGFQAIPSKGFFVLTIGEA